MGTFHPASIDSPLARRSAIRRDAIIAAAEEVFLDKGFASASVDAVARRANASKATIYAHFGNKIGLFRAILGNKLKDAFAPLAAANLPALPADQVLRRVGTSFLTLMLSPTAIKFYRVMTSQGPEFPDLAQTWFENGPKVAIGKVAQFLRDRTAAGELSVERPEQAAEFFLMMLRGVLHLRAVTGLDQPPFDAAIAAKVDAAVLLFMAAYGVKSPHTPKSRRTA
ncbi:MAG: TetR/AcrR family transcriptional regulator [Rhodospirillaceae bacterium]|nr:TetR/AcrR family transcriptional regulator [Rhodospirillaceae bacterium]